MGTKILTATIPSGESISNPIGLGDNVLVGIIIPSAWTTAPLTFSRLRNGDDIKTANIMNDTSGDAISYDVAAGVYIAVDPLLWIGVESLIIVSGPHADQVEQGADRVITLVVSDLN